MMIYPQQKKPQQKRLRILLDVFHIKDGVA